MYFSLIAPSLEALLVTLSEPSANVHDEAADTDEPNAERKRRVCGTKERRRIVTARVFGGKENGRLGK